MILKVIYKTTSLFLTFVLLTNSISNVVIITDFVINQDFIAKTLCIQKEAQKGCNGKCQLKKELAQSNTNSNSDTPLPTANKTSLDVFVTAETTAFNPKNNLEISLLQNNIDFRLKLPISKFYDIDTPPPNLS